ncbi:GntR family transcriptional regulator [Pleionea mediterranea]|uniref:GntR family transcriptional regulator n=1 Tax=Pleionea mediterranea TaxID=523701 RepID=A0A316FD45_9GAMM|nr:GntR family transcriptional regulator [Pleionea mediterranea]PWK46329.1 GntR family transcriptional regulator [Pleionea mediterranea]
MPNDFLSLQISPSSGVPIYRQLMDQIKRMVASEQLNPGDTLPSVRSVATHLAVNPMTISKAYSLLEVEGLLERQRGKGMIVSMQQPEKKSKQQRLELLRPSMEKLINDARQLDLDLDTVLTTLQKLFK